MSCAFFGTIWRQLMSCCLYCSADLAGFTSWSSNRTPAQVFELLEVLYNAFDTIALRRSVFKVETIGDCYLGKLS